jgi:hypothetical protein
MLRRAIETSCNMPIGIARFDGLPAAATSTHTHSKLWGEHMIQRNSAAVRGLGTLVLSITAALANTSVQAAGLNVVMAPSLD